MKTKWWLRGIYISTDWVDFNKQYVWVERLTMSAMLAKVVGIDSRTVA